MKRMNYTVNYASGSVGSAVGIPHMSGLTGGVADDIHTYQNTKKGSLMHKHHFSIPAVVTAIVAAALVAAALPGYAPAAGVAHAAGAIKFSGKYSGKASVTVTGSSIKISSVSGSGSGTDGLSKLTGSNGTGHTSGTCGFFSGPASISGSGGSLTLAVNSTSKGCGESNVKSVSGTASVSGGSGKLKGAKGTLSFSGSYNKSAGTFTVTISGSLT